MASNTIISSIVTGGSNNHATVAEEANAVATDFVSQGVVGAITLNTGSGGTGSFCVNADASPDMGVTVKAGQAYISATPSSQDSQILRARASTDYTAYTINTNSSGSTKYDWIYLQVNPTNANNPASDASNVTSIYTSRSTSNVSDTGSPPTYGLALAVVTVANGASSISNGNIADKRFNSSIGSQNGSLIVTQLSTGTDAIIQAAGVDSIVAINLQTKGGGSLKLNGTDISGAFIDYTSTSTIVGWSSFTDKIIQYKQIGKIVYVNFTLGGTSNSANASFTVPIAAQSTNGGTSNYCIDTAAGLTIDGGATQSSPARIYIDPSVSTTQVSMTKNLGVNNWTSSGNKVIRGIFWYPSV